MQEDRGSDGDWHDQRRDAGFRGEDEYIDKVGWLPTLAEKDLPYAVKLRSTVSTFAMEVA